MRKKIECAFEIMKGHFYILKYWTRTQSIDMCDEIWKTDCDLHNMLLFIDGLHKNWGKGACSDYEKIILIVKREIMGNIQ